MKDPEYVAKHFAKVRAASAKRVAKKARDAEKSLKFKGSYGIGGLFGDTKPKRKTAKKTEVFRRGTLQPYMNPMRLTWSASTPNEL